MTKPYDVRAGFGLLSRPLSRRGAHRQITCEEQQSVLGDLQSGRSSGGR
jgi:hypothetical protein